MTIREAIETAEKNKDWNATENKPTSVSVTFESNYGYEDQTELDLFSSDKTTELEELWESLCDEMNSGKNKIIEVKAYGYLKD